MSCNTAPARFPETAHDVPFTIENWAHADAHKWFDDDAEKHRVDVTVSNPRFGPLFGFLRKGPFGWIIGAAERPYDGREALGGSRRGLRGVVGEDGWGTRRQPVPRSCVIDRC